MLKRGATFKQKNNWKSGQFVLGYRAGESGVFGDEIGSVFNILLFCFVFNTFQATLERIIHIRKLACALGSIIATKDTPPPQQFSPARPHGWAIRSRDWRHQQGGLWWQWASMSLIPSKTEHLLVPGSDALSLEQWQCPC